MDILECLVASYNPLLSPVPLKNPGSSSSITNHKHTIQPQIKIFVPSPNPSIDQTLHVPTVMAESVVTFVLDHLAQLVAHEANLLYGVEDRIQSLQNELQMINALLNTAKNKKGISNTVMNQIRDVAHLAEDVIDTFVAKVSIYRRRTMLGRMLHSFGQARLFHHVADQIDRIRTNLNEIRQNKDNYDALQESNNQSTEEDEKEKESAQSLHELRRNVEEENVVGFVDDTNNVLELLLEGGSERNVVSIIGMGGSGKTTLARKVYNSSRVDQHFTCRAWIYVSNECTVRELLLGLLKHLMPNFEQKRRGNKKGKKITQDNSSLSEEELKNLVRNCLKSETYLVVVDDLWKTQDWDKVQDAFPDNDRSRILITSRLNEVALHTPRGLSYYLQPLSKEESWKLFCRKVFRGQDYPSYLDALGMQMVQRCHGLPLSIIVLAGLLAYKEKSHKEWSKVVDHVNWYLIQDETQVKDIVLNLSYNNLPRRLKPCFLYLGIFPEDFEIPVTPLLQKWVAEGFIQNIGNRNPDEVAEDYLNELINRSLVQVAKLETNGGVKTCHVHDLLRDLCISKSKEDKVFEVCTDNNILIPTKPRRLCIHSKMDDYISSSNNDNSCIRSLFLFGPDYNVSARDWKWLSKGLKLIRVLEVGPTWLGILSNLGNFIHLRYLRIEATPDLIFVPSSILNLWNLQTIYLGHLRYETPISFPIQMWKLKHLRHLNARGPIQLRGSCSETYEKMWNLQTISSLVLDSQTTSLIKKEIFPNLKRIGLRVTSEYNGELPKLLLSLQQPPSRSLNKLEIVFHDMYYTGCEPQELLESLGQFNYLTFLKIGNASNLLTSRLAFPPNIAELKLSEIKYITDEGMNGLGNHSKLRILRLSGYVFHNTDTDSFDLNCVGDIFPQLEVFKLRYLNIGKWKLGDGAMPCLQSLVIQDCEKLNDLPNKLWHLSRLRKVQVKYPSKELASMLRESKINSRIQLVIKSI